MKVHELKSVGSPCKTMESAKRGDGEWLGNIGVMCDRRRVYKMIMRSVIHTEPNHNNSHLKLLYTVR